MNAKNQDSDRGPQVQNFGPGKHLIAPALILLAAAVAIAPQLFRGNSCGHDFDFHLVSWLDALNAWRHGIPYPHWSPSPNFGAGEPRFVFYPPLTWMLGAALGFVLPWHLVPVALTFLLLAATGLATRALARHALSEGPATLAGCAALFSGYALFTAYERSAFGELSGGFWVPLALLFILRSRNPSGSVFNRIFDSSAAPLALVVAAAWLSNVPVGIMACYLLAAVALAVALLDRSWAPVLRASVSTVLGLGLAAIYLLPAIWEQHWVDVRQVTDDPGEQIENSWLFAHQANPLLADHDVELRRVSIIAVTMIAVALAGLLIARLRKALPPEKLSDSRTPSILSSKGSESTQPGAPSIPRSLWNGWESISRLLTRINNQHRFWIPLALIPLVILFLQFPVSLPIWNLLPKLRYLQFPWRWLVVLEGPMAIFLAAAVWPSNPQHKRWRIAIISASVLVFLAASAASGILFFQPCDEEDCVPGMLNVYRAGIGFEGTDEYAPPGADNSQVATGLPIACLVTDPSIDLGVPEDEDPSDSPPAWKFPQNTCDATFDEASEPPQAQPAHLSLRAVIPHPGYLILRRRTYPAWQVKVNGQPIASLPERDDGLMAVPVPQGPIDLTVDWTTTPDVLAGRWLSLLSVFLLTALCLLERKLTRPRLS